MTQREKPDRRCIRIFAAFLEKIGQRVSGEILWPEDDAAGEIDAIVGRYAIQHTSVDTLPNGRERDVWFGNVIDGLASEFRNKLGFPLAITLDWRSIQKRHNLGRTIDGLRRWILQNAGTLSDGHHPVEEVSGVPFPFDATKGGPVKFDGVVFIRRDPRDQSLSLRLRDQLVGRHNKLSVLTPYRDQGKKTLLLLESKDIALMNHVKIVEAFQAAFPTWPDGLDELWFIQHVAPPHANIHDLRGGHTWIFDSVCGNVMSHNDNTSRVRFDMGTSAERVTH